MLCKKCEEKIEQGDACVPQDVGNGRIHYYHIGCYCQVKAERIQQECHLQKVAIAARSVH
jgi:hypothetical protein